MNFLTKVRLALEASLAQTKLQVIAVSTGGSYDDQSEKFVVRIMVGDPSSESARAQVDGLLARDGAKAMLEADLRLGGLVSALSVPSHAGHRVFEQDRKAPVLGTELTVLVYP